MPYTTPATAVTGDVILAAFWNTNGRDNILESGPAKVTAQGDMLYATAANALARLAKGSALQQLRMNAGATAPEWFTSAATFEALVQSFVEAGTYKQFSALGPPASVSAAGTYANGTAVGLGYEVMIDGTGTVGGADGGDADADVGAWLFTTGVTANSDAGVIGPEVLYTGDFTLTFRGKFPSDAAMASAFVGIKVMTGGTFADGSNLIGIRVQGTGSVEGVCDAAGTETVRSTGAVGTTEATYRIEGRSGGTIIRFYKNGVQIGADVTTDIPTFVALSVAAGIINNTTTSVIMHVHDLFTWREV